MNVHDPRIAAQMEAMFAEDLARSREITLPRWFKRTTLDRIKEAIAGLRPALVSPVIPRSRAHDQRLCGNPKIADSGYQILTRETRGSPATEDRLIGPLAPRRDAPTTRIERPRGEGMQGEWGTEDPRISEELRGFREQSCATRSLLYSKPGTSFTSCGVVFCTPSFQVVSP